MSLVVGVYGDGTVPSCFILFNSLKTKCRLLYLKPQFIPRCKHFSSRLQKTNQFMV